MTQTVILRGPEQRALATRLIAVAPPDAVVTIREGKRSLEQNSKLWAMLSDVSRAKPEGRVHSPEVWKCLAMHACGHAVRFEQGLNGEPFPIGFRSSQLSKAQMAELIEFLYYYGAQHNVQWNEDQCCGA